MSKNYTVLVACEQNSLLRRARAVCRQILANNIDSNRPNPGFNENTEWASYLFNGWWTQVDMYPQLHNLIYTTLESKKDPEGQELFLGLFAALEKVEVTYNDLQPCLEGSLEQISPGNDTTDYLKMHKI